MRVKMKTLYASPTRSVGIDEVGEFPPAEAKALIEGGYAVPADADPSDGPTVPAAAGKRRPATPKTKAKADAAEQTGGAPDPADGDPGDGDPGDGDPGDGEGDGGD